MLRPLVISCLFALSLSAVLAPNPNLPLSIELSVTNVNTVGVYWFNFQTPLQLDAGTYLYIKFPAEFETVTNTGCKIVTNFHQPIATTTSCTSSVSYPLVQVTFLTALPALSLFTIQLDGVKNPEFLTTTGPFIVWTKTAKDSQYTSLNKMFGTLSFTALLPTPSSLSAYVNITASGFNNIVSTSSTYTFNVKWDYWIDAGAWFRIVLPTGWSKATGIDSLCTVRNFTYVQIPPSGSFFCETSGQNVYLKGLATSIDPSDPKKCEFSLVVTGIVNPASAKTEASSQFSIDLMDLGTTNILQKLQSYNPAIVPGAITNLQVTKPSYQAKDMNGNQLVTRFSFGFSHGVPQSGSIKLNLPQSTFTYQNDASTTAGTNTLGCAIISGITDIAVGNYATCAVANGNDFTVQNFAAIVVGKIVVVQAVVNVAATDSEVLTVTTMDSTGSAIDTGTLLLSRNYPNSLFAQKLIVSVDAAAGIGTTPTLAPAAAYVIFKLAPTMLLTIGSTIYLTFPPGFSVSSPVCEQTAAGGVMQTLSSCVYNVENRAIVLTTAGQDIPLFLTVTSDIKIKGVTFPTVSSNFENIYEFCATTFIKGTNSDYNHGCMQLLLLPLANTGATNFMGDTLGINVYQGYSLTFSSTIPVTYSATVTPQVRFYCPTLSGASALWSSTLGVTGTPYCIVTGQISKCEVWYESPNAVLTLSLLSSLLASTTYSARTLLYSPSTAATLVTNIVKVGYLENRIFKVISSGSVAWTTTAAGAIFPSKSVNAPTTTTVLQTNTISVGIQLSAVNTPTWGIAVLFPVGWDVSAVTSVKVNTYTCLSTEVELMPSTYKPMVRCASGSAIPLLSTSSKNVIITGIKNPATTSPTTSLVSLSVVYYDNQTPGTTPGTLRHSDTITITSSTMDPTAASMPTASVAPDITERGAKGVHYTYTFTTVNAIPAGGIVILNFPSVYNGYLSNYECQFGIGFAGNNGAALTCSLNSVAITISPLAAVKSGTSMSVVVRRVNNHTTSPITGYFVTTAQSAGFNIDITPTMTVSFPSAFSAGSVYYGTITFEPSTASAKYADFAMDFKTQHRVPEGATVQITVPFDFVDIATAGCVLNFMMASCTAAGHYVNFITAQDISANTLIRVAVNKSFTIPLAKTGLFSILVSYGGTTIDQTSSTLSGTTGNTFTPIPAALPMTITSIDFFPNNQGEPATFTFSFSIPAAVKSTSSIIIWFPEEFDPSINTKNADLECWGNPIEFVGNLLNCKVSTFWKVTISGLMTIPANFQFSVAIGGVMNPISGKIGQFRFAVQDATGVTLHYQVNSGNFSIGKGPNPMKFKILTYANNQLRATNTLTFNFSPASNIPSSDDQGQIFIDLPSEFPLMNIGDQTGWQLPCSTWLFVNDQLSSTNWNDRIQCINYNSNRIIVTGGKAFTALATLTIRITIEQVPGPQLGLNSRMVKIMTYDGVNKVFLDRNYGQLSYVDSYPFVLMGEELLVNNGAVVSVMRGTCSNLLSIQTKDPLHPMRVDIQLTGLMPRVLTSRLSPTNVLTFKTSRNAANFCIAVPADLTLGTYNMHWSKTGDDYYLESTGDEIYSPLAVTSVSVTTSQATITVGIMSDAVAGGHSLPITVTLSNSPYNELIVTPTQVGSIDSGISFDPPSLQFGPGDTALNFYIRANSVINKTEHEIEWQLDGTDASAYIKPSNSLYRATGSDEVPPVVSNARFLSTRNTADAFFIASKRGSLFYQIELAGTPLPSSSQLQSSYTMGQAKIATLFQPSLELQLSFTSLAADTEYVIYTALEDTSGRLSPVKSLSVKTLSDYQSVKFVIDFSPKVSVTHDTSTIQQVLAPEVARALSVSSKRVTMFNVRLDAIKGRLMAGVENVDPGLYTKNAIVVVVANDKYVDMPSPLDIVNALTIDTLNYYLKKHSLTVVSKSAAITLTNNPPTWATFGNIWETDGASITCAGSLLAPGYIHMVIINAGGQTPSSQQVAWGLDGDNKPTRHAFAYFDGLSSLAYAKYQGLNENTRYDVYITATSAYPGNNKAISTLPQIYKGVRTTAIYQCTANCPLYFVADHEWAGVLTLWAALLLA